MKVARLLRNAEFYHKRFYSVATFGGPSLYFHRRSLDAWNPDDLRLCLELIYATLASWGMHRMGRNGSKMRPFPEFAESVIPLTGEIVQARSYRHSAMTPENWGVLERIFKSVKIMTSKTSLVGNSKVMAHLLPNIVPPVDRNYTLKFLKGGGYIRVDLDAEWRTMREIIERLFIPVASAPTFSKTACVWVKKREFPWDTSVFKIIDNLIIGAMQ